jgi:hypothetical protein
MAATVPTIGRVAKAATSSAVLDFLKKPKQALIGATGFPPSLHSSIQFGWCRSTGGKAFKHH